MQIQTVSKSEFKAKALEYLRNVVERNQPLVITHEGIPVVEVSPIKKNSSSLMNSLLGSVIFYKGEFDSVGEDDWEVLK